MKFSNLFTLSALALFSMAKADYYKASRVTYYGGPNDGNSERDPFCQDYASNVPSSVSGISYYVAISKDDLTKSNAKSYCGKTIKLSNAETGRTLSAIVVDKCGSCSGGNIDLSVKAFEYLSANHKEKGVLKQVSWCIVDGPSKYKCPSSSSSSSKKTTTTKKTSSSSSSSSTSVRKTGGVYIELEKGSRYGYCSIGKSIKYYSGNGYIQFKNASHGSQRTRVDAYVNVSKAGLYNLKIKYNNPNSSKVTNRIVVNNNYYSINFSKTGSEWQKVSLKGVPFKAGSNLVEVRATDGYMSFDYVYIE